MQLSAFPWVCVLVLDFQESNKVHGLADTSRGVFPYKVWTPLSKMKRGMLTLWPVPLLHLVPGQLFSWHKEFCFCSFSLPSNELEKPWIVTFSHSPGWSLNPCCSNKPNKKMQKESKLLFIHIVTRDHINCFYFDPLSRVTISREKGSVQHS